ncbi:glycosyl transferase family 4 [Gluconacetobacter diazotrophicus PA1 5]|uniref:Glycosyl transferase n=2 Tax=Gluconacetobacter diazotrophicus TaxID=33996 RepID=A0A7W4I5I5_GLUDI|nr:glycosyl transferase [Gluconacetobacter diazotrophicus]ACI50046.1 glycosyl transferase family 4 [Gluconacetobacter diazotrophicus PA1 5]MBB2156260.1 glycosyl transferase [Gluconacetobacter diazotrophicus]TWB07874.1 UDP-N-acetylmuramyl pentapeptide phosphotransferase/UDP-N-acetylglucosamine-1-phosphate transferase [Gluconacetobacter diazotrophicus]CAP55968.1 putative glycosyl transferase [Gluconacetobacter diazotrophicus PA1 5]
MNHFVFPPSVPFAFLLFAVWSGAALMVAGAIRLGVLDHPGHRSSHTRPTPKGGGIGVVTAFVLAVPAARLLHGLPMLTPAVAGLLAATILLGGVSWLDDVYQWPPSLKLAAQFAASILVVATGPHPTGIAMPIGGAVLSVGVLVFMTNAVNFMDGLNGLASGSILLACLVIGGLASGGADRAGLGDMALILAAALAGFLPFNFPAARIFMGDVGSQSCGLLMGAFGLAGAAGGTGGGLGLAVPLLMAGLLYDVGYTLLRRWRNGARLVESHREHLYQLATQAGMSPVVVTLVQWAFVLWGGVAALLMQQGRTGPAGALVLVLLPQLGWTGIVRGRIRRMPPRDA